MKTYFNTNDPRRDIVGHVCSECFNLFREQHHDVRYFRTKIRLPNGSFAILSKNGTAGNERLGVRAGIPSRFDLKDIRLKPGPAFRPARLPPASPSPQIDHIMDDDISLHWHPSMVKKRESLIRERLEKRIKREKRAKGLKLVLLVPASECAKNLGQPQPKWGPNKRRIVSRPAPSTARAAPGTPLYVRGSKEIHRAVKVS